MRAVADCAASLGSCFNLTFDPEGRRVYHDARGLLPGSPAQLTVAVELRGGERICLPFCDAETYFERVEYFPSLTGFKYRGTDQGTGLELTLSVRAPFYPRDIKLSTAPFYLIRATVRRPEGWREADDEGRVDKGRIVFSLDPGKPGRREAGDGFKYGFESLSEVKEQGKVVHSKAFETACRCRGMDAFESDAGEIYVPFDFSRSPASSLKVLWSGWTEDSVLEVGGKATGFKYRHIFRSESAMAEWALENRVDIEKKCRFLDSAVRNSSMGAATVHICALALHCFLAHTWWTVRENGKDWFSVCSGDDGCQSAIGVEYNLALMYLNLWPELLDMQLHQWAEFDANAAGKGSHSSAGASSLSHDTGAGHVIGRSFHRHRRQVEANADFLLLIAARTAFTGDLRLLQRHMPLCRRLAAFITDSDSDGDGFPDLGTDGTVGDLRSELQTGRSQTYLGIKVQAALWALSELEEPAGVSGSKAFSERWKAFAAKGIKTLDENGWIKDHYSVCLQRKTEGLVDPGTGEALPGGELEGWDACSIHTANGLLYLFITNMKMPRWNHTRLIRDIHVAEAAARTHYGSADTSGKGREVWFSQNMWRDYTAAYYGIDYLNNIERYRDFMQVYSTGRTPALYSDGTRNQGRRQSPRGAVAFGALMASAGLRINRLEKEICLAPIRRTLRVPVPALADWEAMRMPWIIADTRDGVTTVRITGQDLLGGFKIYIAGAELEGA